MTSPTAVARAVARDAERRARTALDDVLAAHTALTDADAALAAATRAKADAGPDLARAITGARAAGITIEQLAELGIPTPSSRTLRRRHPPRPAAEHLAGHQPPHLAAISGVGTPATTGPDPRPTHPVDAGHGDAHPTGHQYSQNAAS